MCQSASTSRLPLLRSLLLIRAVEHLHPSQLEAPRGGFGKREHVFPRSDTFDPHYRGASVAADAPFDDDRDHVQAE
jgi:hypothetical protein